MGLFQKRRKEIRGYSVITTSSFGAWTPLSCYYSTSRGPYKKEVKITDRRNVPPEENITSSLVLILLNKKYINTMGVERNRGLGTDA
jgi:hypothetical protein